jgi:tetratricopeptide (TPR) repeat protein
MDHGLWTCSSLAAKSSAYEQAVGAFNQRRLDDAFKLAKRAVRQSPRNPDAHFLLGQLHYLRQELEKAKERWEKALKLSPGREDIRGQLEKLLREMNIEQDLSRSDTHPFVVRFAKGQVPVDLGGLKRMLRDTHRKIGQQFSYFPDHRITVLLYASADFQQVKTLSHQVSGLYDGKIRLPLSPGRLDSQELKRILWHEYTHAIVHDLSQGACPVWFNEGIATLQEDRVKSVDVSLARAAYEQDQLPTWDTLWAGRYEAGTLQVNYQISYLIVGYLVKRWSWGKLKSLLAEMGQGIEIQAAMRKVYREDPANLEIEWRRWLRRQL